MRRAGREMDSVIDGVDGFDAKHLLPIVRRHIGEALGFFDPWIPHHRRVRAALFDNDAAVERRVVNYASGLSVEIYAIGFLHDADYLIRLRLALECIGLIDVRRVRQPRNGNLVDIANGEVSMQRFFVNQGSAEWFCVSSSMRSSADMR